MKNMARRNSRMQKKSVSAPEPTAVYPGLYEKIIKEFLSVAVITND